MQGPRPCSWLERWKSGMLLLNLWPRWFVFCWAQQDLCYPQSRFLQGDLQTQRQYQALAPTLQLTSLYSLTCIIYGCQTWSLTKATTQRLRKAQRAMERKMLKAKLKDKIPCREIRAKTNIKDVVKFAAKQKWKWAGHVARLNDNRWTKRITDWQPKYGKRSRGRQAKRWRDDIVQMKGITWGRDARQRDDWRRDAEGYILQWMDGASV